MRYESYDCVPVCKKRPFTSLVCAISGEGNCPGECLEKESEIKWKGKGEGVIKIDVTQVTKFLGRRWTVSARWIVGKVNVDLDIL